MGVQPGDRVGVLATNGWRQAELYFGISKAGAVVVPLNWRLSEAELTRVVADADPRVLLVEERFQSALGSTGALLLPMAGEGGQDDAYERRLSAATPLQGALDHCSEDNVTMIAYTSGTTGEPKGVMHTHRSLLASAMRLALEMRLEPSDVFFGCLPFFFAGANSALVTPLMRGCTVVAADFSSDAFFSAVEEHGVTATIMVPTMIAQILNHPRIAEVDLSAVTKWSYAGASLSRTQTHRALERFGQVFIQMYGQVETGLMGTTLHPTDHQMGVDIDHRLGAVGIPSTATQVRVVGLSDGRDVPWDGETLGEVWVRGPSLMAGYWRNPEATKQVLQDGWMRTSDIAVRDGDGYLYLVDRVRDMIITGGINVFPREIEDVIARHPFVDQVAVIGLASEEWGETVTACVTLRGQADDVELEREILALCSDHLAGYKRPRRIIFLESLPLTGSGKVSKRDLRTMMANLMRASGT